VLLPVAGAAVIAFFAGTGGAAAEVDFFTGTGGGISADIEKMGYSPCHIQIIVQ